MQVTLTSHSGKHVGVGEGYVGGQFLRHLNYSKYFIILFHFVSDLHNCLELSRIAFLEKYCYFVVYKQFICKR